MSNPEDLKYTSSHEWVRVSGDIATIGITSFAQDALGDVVYFDAPEVGEDITKGDTFGEIESVKAVSDLYAPVSGAVTEVNEQLEDAAELVNQDPYGAGWMIRVQLSDAGELDDLMDAAAYASSVAE